jgi:hypothetical protein
MRLEQRGLFFAERRRLGFRIIGRWRSGLRRPARLAEIHQVVALEQMLKHADRGDAALLHAGPGLHQQACLEPIALRLADLEL